MSETGRFLLIELESGVPRTRVQAFRNRCLDFAGVVSVTDLAGIDQETLDAILLKPEPVVAPIVAERVVQEGLPIA